MGSHPYRPFTHVCWIGGAPCSGKSSIVAHLARRRAFRSYNCDDAFARHAFEATPESQPTLHRISRMTWDEIWLRPVAALLDDVLHAYTEEWSMILRDLASMPTDLPIVAEGAALMPAFVAPLLTSPRQAVWVVPTEAFQRATYPARGAWVREILDGCAEPERAFANWMARDAAFARRVCKEATEHGLRVLVVDGRRTIAENAATVEAWFFDPFS